ncbi:RraA family protein [Geodermatophilus ruber]|uniref:Putative 4-hydroxy-4-methyl-2-oxoglutarate aldolase n=1 Tax=Geodermatophilus ruber TaxID=504800 RepID=A0A1I4GXA5_9ACTN|nr:RraA family protein [Geodermatophilus ruber]SFL33771.1 4-hydroxy-4-methyl-2-oxoglutarate aldolase [Geodermatophilus ruber]
MRDDLLARAAHLGASTVHEAAGRIGALPSSITALYREQPAIAGRAATVLCPDGDNLWLHRAIYTAAPGEVLVVEVGTGEDFGYWGEIMATAAQERGIAGLVISGCVRDAVQMQRLGFPVFSTGTCIRGTVKDPLRPGAIGGRLRLGDVLVSPGDLVVGDADGVVVVPAEQAEAAVAAGEARERKEAGVMEQLRAGGTTLEIFGLPAGGGVQ